MAPTETKTEDVTMTLAPAETPRAAQRPDLPREPRIPGTVRVTMVGGPETPVDLTLKGMDLESKTAVSDIARRIIQHYELGWAAMTLAFENGTLAEYLHPHGDSDRPHGRSYTMRYAASHGVTCFLKDFEKEGYLRFWSPVSHQFSVACSPAETIGDLKARLAMATGIPAERQLVRYRPIGEGFHSGYSSARDEDVAHELSLRSIPPLRVRHSEDPSFLVTKVVVKTLTGKSISLEVSPSTTMAQIKDMVQTREGIPPDQQRLIHNGAQFTDETTLEDALVADGDAIHLVLRLRGGGGRPSFVDVSRTDALVTRKWNRSAPEWRRACSGISIEGRCTAEERCPAHGRMVIDNRYSASFDLLTEKAMCPVCSSEVIPDKPGFSNCFWRTLGLKADGKSANVPWIRAGDNYTTYDEKEAGAVAYSHLLIMARGLDRCVVRKRDGGDPEAKEISIGEACTACHHPLRPDACAMLDGCGHTFHEACIREWLPRDPRSACPTCRTPATASQIVEMVEPVRLSKKRSTEECGCCCKKGRGETTVAPTALIGIRTST